MLEPHRSYRIVPSVAARQRVLIVDDDNAHLRALGRLLKRYKDRIELTVVDNGIDALIQVGVARPHLVLLDVFMPGLDGLEVCRRLKANPETAGVEVILTSAGMTPELEAEALAAGASRAVGKPYDVTAILDELAASVVAPTVAAPVAIAVSEPGPTRRAADVLVDVLADAGVDVLFGLPGGPISPVHDALLDSDVRVVTTRHESGALFAAAGYAHTTGNLGVAVVTSGPGVMNSMTGLASAWCDGLPLLLLVGEAPRPLHGKGVLQDGSAYGLNIVGMASHITKLAAEIPAANQLPHLLKRAIATARSGRRGPVLLTLPMDVTTAQIAPPRVAGVVHVDVAVPSAMLDDVAALFATATRPLILAGSGVRGGDAPARLRRVAERLGCPVATTPKGKGVFSEAHPLALGVMGLGGHPSVRAYLDGGVDLLVAIGTSLGDLSTDGFSPALQGVGAFVHVDIDARQIGKSYAPTHAVVAPAEDFLGGLETRLRSTGRRHRVAPAGGVVRHELAPSLSRTTIAPDQALRELQQLLPADTIVTVDSGEHFLFATHYLRMTHPDAWVVMTGLGSMGQSIGAAIGAQLGHPDRTVAAICGDGCFAMNAFEVATAVAERLPIRVFVFDDQRLGMVENGHETVYGRRPHYPITMDVTALAAGLGAATVRIDQPGQLAQHAALLRDHPGPVVVDVLVDPDVRLPKKDRMGAFAPKDPPSQSRVVN
ncbi:MAG: response regulator [Kofleriaceae bacterium]|nr:response regulator [Myxococcales bacterium]MCB9563710.1 response regulator [Kofleriaceae bacterium]MCB9573053.1 response regulator [Kofleriaceae bacterium]